MSSVPKDKALVVAVHHPHRQQNRLHGGSAVIEESLEGAFKESGRLADLVLTGHVHNYQRFTRQFEGWDIPYIVAGSGWYHNLHRLNPFYGENVVVPYKMPNVDNLTLESYLCGPFGFTSINVTEYTITGQYNIVPNSKDMWSDTYRVADKFQMDLETHKVSQIC